MFRLPGNPHFDVFHIVSSLLIGSGFLLVYSGWRTLYEAAKSRALATTGPYRFVRHPQYAGFILVMIGFILTWPTILTIAMFPVLVVMYMRLARTEEKSVAAEFGEAYERYRNETPAFLPQLKFGS